MKTAEINIVIPVKYCEELPLPPLMEIIKRFKLGQQVKVNLDIDDLNPYYIYVLYNMIDTPLNNLKCNISFLDQELYQKYYQYRKSLQLKGLSAEWTAKVIDIIKDKKLKLKLLISLPWELEENIEEANNEAERIIRSARAKAINERKKILDKLESECNEMREKALQEIKMEKEKLNKYSVRLGMFLSRIANRNFITKEEELHEMLKFLTIYQDEEDLILYKDEESYRKKINDLKKEIKWYRINSKKGECGFDSRVEWIYTLRPQHMSYESWQEWGTRLADYFDDVAMLYAELRPKLGIKTSLTKIIDCYYGINKLLNEYGIKLSEKYISLWEELINTCSKFDLYKRNKKIQEREEKEAERERIKAEKEYEKAIRQAEKDEAAARRKLEETQKELENQKQDEKKYNQLKEQIKKLEQALQDAIERGERAMSMAQQTKKGFVYIISNVNSFGDNVYKIGLTRRLDPTERIDELSNASVPFPFQIHAIIESEDAPALEAKLHRIFYEHKMNKTNWRKEFFKVTLEDINKVLEEEGIITNVVNDYSKFDYKIHNSL